jgi:hypothetical protein
MTGKKWLLAALLALPLAVGGGLVYAHSQGGLICPFTGEPISCGWCCPLNESTSQSQNEETFPGP